ncbi:efflux RND transporter periplasmic adaptor subunit [Acidicapsa acidisoli]|uniref:efflux RND transporter periplasmic adaptor subunit n=1 Tax=Acidicapsa acidisoli TaxID=1615681 RepID=UPI0037C065F5
MGLTSLDRETGAGERPECDPRVRQQCTSGTGSHRRDSRDQSRYDSQRFGRRRFDPHQSPRKWTDIAKNVTPGSTISTSTDAFVIGDLSRLWMLASVDAATLSKLRVGQTATITLPDAPDAAYPGRITNLGQEFDPVRGTHRDRAHRQSPSP